MSVCVDRKAPILRLKIKNPPANLLSLEVMQALQAELGAAARDEEVRVVVIAAAGKLFSAGHDLKQMTTHRSDSDGGERFFEETFSVCARLMQAIVNLPKAVIAEVDGVATAAGCQLVASCDLAVASERSRFGVNGIDVGVFCTTPSIALTRNVARKHAMHMLLTGEMISAATAREIGLVNRVVPHETLTQTVDAYARLIAAKSPTAVALGKAAVTRQSGMPLAEAYEHASQVMIENMMAPDAKEGIDAFLQKRLPRTPPPGTIEA